MLSSFCFMQILGPDSNASYYYRYPDLKLLRNPEKVPNPVSQGKEAIANHLDDDLDSYMSQQPSEMDADPPAEAAPAADPAQETAA